MSTLKTDYITDAAGTGAPDFPNGLSGSGASLTALPAGQLTGSLPAISGAALTNLPAPTSAQVGSAIAGVTAGDVGSFLFGTYAETGEIVYGASVAGSSLKAGCLNTGGANTESGTRSGTWRFLGYQSGVQRYTIFMRIS